MSALFTIALPVRNGGVYLRACVESILAQTRADFSLAILDNASTDGTADYLAGLRDPRVRLYPAERPLSIEENWARILAVPKGEYLTAIGHDDLLDPNFLETIAGLIRVHPDAGLYMTHFRLIDEHGKFLRHCQPMPARETAADFLAVRLFRLRDSYGTGYVFRSAAYDAVGGIPAFPKLLYADDALVMRLTGSSYRATALEEAFSYRTHAASVARDAAMRDAFAGLEQYVEVLRKLQENDLAVRAVLRRHFADYVYQLGVYRLREERREAYRARRPVDPMVRQGILTLAKTFGEASQLFPTDDLYSLLMEKAAVSRWARLAFQGLSWGAAGRVKTRNLFRSLRRRGQHTPTVV